MDMTPFVAARSDQLNSDDLLAGPRTVTVTRVAGSDSPDQPVSVFYEGDNGKPFKPCRTMRRVMVAVWGKDAATYTGKSMTLYRDGEVAFGGMKVGGIRISHMSHMDGKKSMALTATRGKKAMYTVHPLTDAPKQQQQTEGPNARQIEVALAELETAAGQGTEALQTKWQGIGADARKALANELPRLKSLAAPPDDGDVPFDAQPAGGAGYDGV